jgi:hypothetical protein
MDRRIRRASFEREHSATQADDLYELVTARAAAGRSLILTLRIDDPDRAVRNDRFPGAEPAKGGEVTDLGGGQFRTGGPGMGPWCTDLSSRAHPSRRGRRPGLALAREGKEGRSTSDRETRLLRPTAGSETRI